MKDQFITDVVQQMLPYLDNVQMKHLQEVMEQALFHFQARKGGGVMPTNTKENGFERHSDSISHLYRW